MRNTVALAVCLLVATGCHRAGQIQASLAPQTPQDPNHESLPCLDNVKQITNGMLMYADDYDGVLPAEDWQRLLLPYVRSRDVFTCPTVASRGQTNGYAMNSQILGKSQASIANPQSTAVVFESLNLVDSAVETAPGTGFKVGRHPEGDSTGFLDGHVKPVP